MTLDNQVATIRDVAKQAGVSQSTVSRVLNSSKTQIPISQETRQRVQKIVDELGYRPHPGARSLSGNGTGLLGVIMRDIDDPFFAVLIDVVSHFAKEQGYELVLGNAEGDPEKALALRDRMLDPRHCDGLLLCGDLRESLEDQTFLARIGQNHRLVSVSRGSTHLVRGMAAVSIDNRKGALLALDYLFQLGHRRIACQDVGRVGDIRERLDAYRAFMQERLGGVPEGYIQVTQNDCGGGYEATRRLLSLPEPPTAIFAMDDMMAIGALGAVADMGRVVPENLSIVGFDDIKVSAFVRPALTTVRQPIEELGRKAVELLLTMIASETPCDPCSQLVLEPELIIRDSCAPPSD
jgi:LacI family transcriptional regulator